jgi:hypothetical protein
MPKRHSTVSWVIAVLISISLSGCTLAKISGRGNIPILLNNPPARVTVVKHVETSKMVNFDYTGAFDVSEVMGDMLANGNADAITNVTIVVKSTGANFLLNLVTLGIANSKTFEIAGDLVKAPRGLGLLDLPGTEVLARAERIEDLKVTDDTLTSDTMIARVPSGYALIRFAE